MFAFLRSRTNESENKSTSQWSASISPICVSARAEDARPERTMRTAPAATAVSSIKLNCMKIFILF